MYTFCVYVTGDPRVASWALEQTFLFHARVGGLEASSDSLVKLLRTAWSFVNCEFQDTTVSCNLLDRAVLRLSPQLRAVYVLYSALGLTHQQAAQVLKVDSKRERELWINALSALRRLLPAEFFDRAPKHNCSGDSRNRAPAQKNGAGLRQAGLPDESVGAGLMSSVKQDSIGAFEALAEKFGAEIAGFMFRLFQLQALGEELATQVFIRAYSLRDTYARTGGFRVWLYQIAAGVALDRLESDGPLGQGDRASTEPSVAGDVGSAGADNRSDKRRKAIQREMRQLPFRQRLALVMHQYQQLDFQQISQILKLREPEVKSLLADAYSRLHKDLGEFF